MSCVARSMRSTAVLLLALQLAACSKSIQWEEEVPLNTGETIWVKRTDSYVRGGDAGNPLKIVWWLEQRNYEFEWQGKRLSYLRRTRTISGPIGLYVVTPGKAISVVDSAAACSKPGWVEYRWQQDAWRLQDTFDPALVGLPRNLMAHFSADDGEIPQRVTSGFKRKEDTAQNRAAPLMQIESQHIASACSGR